MQKAAEFRAAMKNKDFSRRSMLKPWLKLHKRRTVVLTQGCIRQEQQGSISKRKQNITPTVLSQSTKPKSNRAWAANQSVQEEFVGLVYRVYSNNRPRRLLDFLLFGWALVKFYYFPPPIFDKFITKQKRKNTALTSYRVFTVFIWGGGGSRGKAGIL